MPAAGATALAIDETGNQLVIGYGDGRIATLGLDLIDAAGGAGRRAPVPARPGDRRTTRVDHLLVMTDGTTLAAASSDRLTTIDLDGATVLGTIDLPGIADLAPGGTGPALTAVVDAGTDLAARRRERSPTSSGTDAADYEARLTDVAPGTTVVLGEPGSGKARTDLDAAIADGTLTGVAVDTVPRIAVATDDGVEFIVPDGAARLSTDPARRRGARPGDGDGPRRPEAVCDVRRCRRSRVRRHRRRRRPRPRTGRSTGHSTRLPAPGTWRRPTTRPARWSTSSAWRRA